MGEELRDDDSHVDRVRHPEEQIKRLPLDRFIRVLEAINHNHLVVRGILRMVSDDRGETSETYQIIIIKYIIKLMEYSVIQYNEKT